MSNALQPGDMFLEYRIVRVLDEGGMGVVYEAVEVYPDDPVAIKCLLPRYSNREDFAARFQQESKIYPRLKHPNIVRMRRAGVTQDTKTAFIVMDLLEGRTLRKLLAKYHRLDLLNTLHIMNQIAEAMLFAHQKGIWHRDLKPENIMVGTKGGEKGHVRLLDFGIAKAADSGMNTDDLPNLGTARYLSPEQVRSIFNVARNGVRTKPDGRADIYAFGVIFYEVLSGRHIFIDDEDPPTFEETLTGHLLAKPKPVHEIVSDCPESVWSVIAKCIAINPDERFQTFEEVFDALSELVRGSVPPAHPLAQRFMQQQKVRARAAAFDALPDEKTQDDTPAGSPKPAVAARSGSAPAPMEDEPTVDATPAREAITPAPPPVAERSALVTLPAALPRARVDIHTNGAEPAPEGRPTAPLVGYIPDSSPLPFGPPRSVGPLGPRGTTKMSRPDEAALAARVAQLGGRSAAAYPGTPPPAPLVGAHGTTRMGRPDEAALTMRQAGLAAQAGTRRSATETPEGVVALARPSLRPYVVGPLIGLAVATAGSAVVYLARTSDEAPARGAASSVPIASASATAASSAVPSSAPPIAISVVLPQEIPALLPVPSASVRVKPSPTARPGKVLPRARPAVIPTSIAAPNETSPRNSGRIF